MKKHERCRIRGTSGTSEIPLLSLLLDLLDCSVSVIAVCHTYISRLSEREAYYSRTLTDWEFDWGGTSVKI